MSQVTVLTGPERRRRWSEDERIRIVATAFMPGAVVTDVARRFDVSTSLIYKWRAQAMALAAGDRLAPVVLVEDQRGDGAAECASVIIVDLAGGARVSIGASAPAALVTAALRALR
jgi:transposase